MPTITVTTTRPHQVDLEYEAFGAPEDPALVAVGGLGAQLTAWDAGFCQRLADAGRYVIRFDNRDSGLSTKLDGQPADPAAVLAARDTGAPVPVVAYTLSDLANDVVGLLDALGLTAAHLVGASMGGMIAQTVAIEHPDRVLSLTSIMSTPGFPAAGEPTPEALEVLMAERPADRSAYVDASVRSMVWTSRRYSDEALIRRRAGEQFDRSYYPEGIQRQMAAIYASGDRTAGLATLHLPALVIHGRDDTLITPSGGAATAEAIPGAAYLLVTDMGHDLPEPLWPLIIHAILGIGEVGR